MQKRFDKTIIIPKEVQAEVTANFVKLKLGEKEVEKKFQVFDVEIKKIDEGITVFSKTTKKKSIAVVNSIASQISNLYAGLNKDFEYKLEIVYSHFPMNVNVKEDVVEINNLAGGKKLKRAKIVGNAKVTVKGKEVTVTAPNKEHAGQTAANLEIATKIRGKDKRIFQDGIYIVSKAAKVTGEKNNE